MKSTTQRAISMGYRIDSSPANLGPAGQVRAMIAAVKDNTGNLPLGLHVTWTIRGNEYEFGYVVRTSTNGLRGLMVRRLTRDLEAL